ncbi:hypothetical protein PGTUg99_012240 [Puccinia graminis f. sp. tritici]|uniref:Uncharacterized protein n=1 Tax=Puccinia graminis f. sp. tritici TaxID=56615 RepID=A0A5B0NS70_PUCGR|nr:hypothetical protein PGTUg99_012240 [Puccinia graminis f. sp. tritici]
MSHEFKVKRVLPSTDSASDSNPFFLNLKTKIPLITYPIDKSLNPLSIIHLNCTFDPNHLLSQINFTQEELGRKTGGERRTKAEIAAVKPVNQHIIWTSCKGLCASDTAEDTPGRVQPEGTPPRAKAKFVCRQEQVFTVRLY